jgi:hypothetical protein
LNEFTNDELSSRVEDQEEWCKKIESKLEKRDIKIHEVPL